MEDLNWLAAHLPETVDGALEEEIMDRVYGARELGENLILYSRESVEWGQLRRIVEAPMETKRGWGARCTCKNCGEDFYTGYISGGARKQSGIMLGIGEDGCSYGGLWEPGEEMVQIFHEGEEVCCPLCGDYGILTPRRELRNGRAYGVLQAQVKNVEGYTAVLYWMVRRYLDDEGGDHICATPRDALVIDRDGRIQRFSHVTAGMYADRYDGAWRWSGSVREPALIRYRAWGACNNRQVGAWVFDHVPDLTGSTGEKSALEEYVRCSGVWPGLYLLLWMRHRNVENLMRGGFGRAVAEAVDRCTDEGIAYGNLRPVVQLGWCDWREVKPYRMVGMAKEDWRSARDECWGEGTLRGWNLWRREEKTGVAAFREAECTLGGKGIAECAEMRRAGWEAFDPAKVARYIRKQDVGNGAAVRMLIDYRKMLHDLHMEETEETLWPRSLQAAHDRVTEYKLAHLKDIYQAGFPEAREKYAPLEWTDGELRIVVPCNEEELKREGKVLRHCVGTYGYAHTRGRPIFFVRKYRRPERSYYTLNVDLTGRMPQEVQLHGYGNERHGENKQHSHRIPQKVRDFVDRWEREVLTPWWAEQKRQEAAEKKKAKEKTA